MTTLHLRKSIGRSPLRLGLLLITLALVCFALSPAARAVTPPPDGGYPNQTTAEGHNALFNLTSGAGNTALGFNALYFNTAGDSNGATGAFALYSNTTGHDNTANGVNALLSNTTGNLNTGSGSNALSINTTGSFNTATGVDALYSNTTGDLNTAAGVSALSSNTTGNANTASGTDALASNTTAVNNTAVGYQALYSNTTGGRNTAVGYQALYSQTSNPDNLPSSDAVGFQALYSNSTGWGNDAMGWLALNTNTTGTRNISVGFNSLSNNTTGSRNVCIGINALNGNTTGGHNTVCGDNALALGTPQSGSFNFNIALGHGAGWNLSAGDNNVYITNPGVAIESNTIRIGNQVPASEPDDSAEPAHTRTFIAGISGTGVSGPAVKINSSGQLGVPPSSARFKDEIKPMDKASEAILALKPVTFRYKKQIDAERTPQFGLVAEEVEKVNPDLIERDKEGKPYTVRYDAVNTMLLNEFLKAHRQMQEQQAMIAKQQKQIEVLTTGLQKVSDQLEAGNPAPQVVNNP